MSCFVNVDGAPPTLTMLARSLQNAGATTAPTFGSVPFGPDAPDRYIIALLARDVNNSTTGGTIAGVPATVIGNVAGAYSIGGIMALVPTGATGSITVNVGTNVGRRAFAVWSLTGWQGINRLFGSVINRNIVANTCIAAQAMAVANFTSGPQPSISYTGLTNDAQQTAAGFITSRAAWGNFPSAQTPLAMSCAITSTGGGGAAEALFWN